MTKLEFYKHVAANTITDEDIAFAETLIEKDAEVKAKAKEKRKNTPSKTAEANKPIAEAILAALNDQPQTASDLAAIAASALGIEVSTQKASAVLRTMTGVASTDVKVTGKNGKVKGYTLA